MPDVALDPKDPFTFYVALGTSGLMKTSAIELRPFRLYRWTQTYRVFPVHDLWDDLVETFIFRD